MDKFFNNLFQGDKKKDEGGNKLGGGGGGAGGGGPMNPFAGLGQKKFQGSGKSLGGTHAGKIIPIELKDPGTLGLKVEKGPNSNRAIVSTVIEGSQAHTAGLMRGDILCFAGSNGQSEIMYSDFLAMAKSGQRPVVFEVRRVETKTQIQKDTKSADEYARKQAVIAAAEAREKAHKAKTKPVKMGEKKLPVILSAAEKRQQELERERDAQLRQQEAPRTEEARRAMEAAKRNEAELANQLGYNPYETNKATAGQARHATVTVQHGSVGGGGKAKANPDSIPSVRPPADPTAPAMDDGANQSSVTEDAKILAKCPGFYETYTTVVTSNADNAAVVKSFGIMRTLVKNATTKGQNTEDGEDAAAKFRRVRLGNPKIKAAILDVTGALELMMLFGFQLSEEDGESVLVFPFGDTGPDILPAAMRHLERYEKESSS